MILLRVFAIIVPLMGTIFNPLIALSIVACALFCKSSSSFGIPTIIATVCWILEQNINRAARITRFILNFILPILCIIFFLIHPVGRQAFAYALYWLIPPILLLFVKKYIMGTALRITFITHAVGSILWLYTIPTTPSYWLTLIPVVAVERLCLASATVGVLVAIKLVQTHWLMSRKILINTK